MEIEERRQVILISVAKSMPFIKNPNYNPSDPKSKRFISTLPSSPFGVAGAGSSIFDPNPTANAPVPLGDLFNTPKITTPAVDSKKPAPPSPITPSTTEQPSGALNFKADINDRQRSEFDKLLNSGRALNEIDARNLAFATGQSDFRQFIGKTGADIQGTGGKALEGDIIDKNGNVIPSTGNRVTDEALKTLADQAGAAGLTLEEYTSLVTQTSTPTAEESEAIRNRLGIPGLIDSTFSKPQQTTVELYKGLYDLSGLKGIKDEIARVTDEVKQKKKDLTSAEGELRSNPWISQATRSGRLGNLNRLAIDDISNSLDERDSFLDLYDRGIDEIESAIVRQQTDEFADRSLAVDKLNFLLTEVEREEGLIARRTQERGLRFVPDFLQGLVGREETEFNRDLLLKSTKAVDIGSSETVQRINEFGHLIQGTAAPKMPSQGERQSFVFFQRMENAVSNLDAIEDAVGDFGLFEQAQLKTGSSFFQSDEIERFAQAQREFTEARLRKDSGAAIPPEEFENDKKTYFPQPGDSPDTLLQKRNSRRVALNANRVASGNAYWELFGESPVDATQRLLQGDSNGSAITPPEAIQTLGNGKTLYRLPNGDTVALTQAEFAEDYGNFNKVGSDTNQASNIQLGSRLAKANNNPGNLRFANQGGASQGEGGFARFTSPQAGYQALKNQIKLDGSRGLTLAAFISKFAPPSENDTNLYINQMIAATGASRNTLVKDINLDRLARAMAKKESSTIIA